MSRYLSLTVEVGIDDVEDYLFKEEAKQIWDNLTDEQKWACYDYIYDNQPSYEFYDGDLCDMIVEWKNGGAVEESYVKPTKSTLKLKRCPSEN